MSARLDKSSSDHALRQRPTVALLAFLIACGGAPARPLPPSSVPSPEPPAAPTEGPSARFRHHRSRLVVATGTPNHRARDVLVVAGEAAVVDAKIAYGPADKDLADEDVRVDREAEGGAFSPIGVARTDRDGRLRFDAGVLPLGSHRVRLTVLGDGSSAELSVVVVTRGQPIFVSDVDGTLTESEIAEVPALLQRTLPPVHPFAPDALRKLAAKGLVPVYVTARPEWLLPRTRALLATNEFPPGVVITDTSYAGRFGSDAARFKRGVLERLVGDGRTKIEWAFGNMPSDAETYAVFVPDPKRRVFYRYTDAFGGRRIDSYEELLADLR